MTNVNASASTLRRVTPTTPPRDGTDWLLAFVNEDGVITEIDVGSWQAYPENDASLRIKVMENLRGVDEEILRAVDPTWQFAKGADLDMVAAYLGLTRDPGAESAWSTLSGHLSDPTHYAPVPEVE